MPATAVTYRERPEDFTVAITDGERHLSSHSQLELHTQRAEHASFKMIRTKRHEALLALFSIIFGILTVGCAGALVQSLGSLSPRHRQSSRHGAVDSGTNIFQLFSEDNKQDMKSLEYRSLSTNDPDISTEFYEGSEQRKSRLHEALLAIGVDPHELTHLPEFCGTSALRTYNSFVVPKSKGALAMAEQPHRATVVANNISFLLREHRSHREGWLRNHDRSLEEAAIQLNIPRNPISLVLDDVRSAHNVGNILRFAEAARCEKVFLCGSMTPAPPDSKVLKTALGAAEYVPHEAVGSTMQAIQRLKDANVRVFAVETTSRSVPLWKVAFFEASEDGSKTAQQIAFVFGNELVGVAVQVLEECERIVSVPTHGIKNSLNVATCASVVTWEALRQWENFKDEGT
jgi:23S rRNA (guanosine2251-2'-O)-methyltransferase